MKRSMIVLSLLFIAAFTFADEDGSLPIVLAHAYEQPDTTSKAMQAELDQFRAVSQWQTLRDQNEALLIKFEESSKALERAETLRAKGAMTEVEYGKTYYAHRVLEAERIKLPNEIIVAKLTAQFHYWRVLQEGSGVDHRLDIANMMVTGLNAEIDTLKGSLALAVDANKMAQDYFEKGQTLAHNGSINSVELEARAVAAKTAPIQIRDVTSQIALAKMALESFTKSQEKLSH